MMAFMAAGFSGCTNDVEMPVDSKGTQTVMMTVDVSRSADDTRSSLSPVNDDLQCEWTADDKLLVTSSSTDGSRLGVLALKEINSENRSKATFSGKLENVANGNNVKVNYIYLGNKGDYTNEPKDKVYTADYTVQNGSIESLSDHDIMTNQADVIIDNGYSYVKGLVLDRRVSFARFKLTMPDEVTFDQNTTVTVTGDGVNNALSINGGSLEATYTSGSLTITPGQNDFYMTLLPNTLSSGFDLTFTVSTADASYTGVYKVTKPIAQGKFYRKDNAGNPIEITLTKDPKTYNPGDMGSWGGLDIDPAYETFTPTWVTDEDCWIVNCRNSEHLGGFGHHITYLHNGIKNNLLTSKGGSCYFFQWGRWLGYPSTAASTLYFSDGDGYYDYYPGQSQYLNGINILNTSLGYVGDTGLAVTYAAAYMGGNTSFTRDKALNWSILFGMVSSYTTHGDYIYANEECKWEDRCGNPCPDGYRIPSASDLEALIPKTVTMINGTHAEVKIVNGVSYAMRWEVVVSNTIPYVEIKSVKTTLQSVSANNAIFNSAPYIRLYAYGYMDNEGYLKSRNSIGVYWSSDSGKNTIKNTTGNGGKYLEIDFNGRTAVLGMDVALRSFGAPVMLIKDDNAKSSTLTPMLPLIVKHNCKFF